MAKKTCQPVPTRAILCYMWLSFLSARQAKHGVVVVACFCAALPAVGLDRGSVAPTVVFEVDTHSVVPADFAGKVIYLDFWASWCGPCKKSFPWMNAMQAKYGAEGLQIIAVDLDAKSQDGRRFLATFPASFGVVFDPAGTSARAYGVKGMPSSFIIGRDGKVALVHTGFSDASGDDLEESIVTALKANK